MISRRALLGAAALLAVQVRLAKGEQIEMRPADEMEWSYLSDTVMGGVSEGRARVADGSLHLTGAVSTANRGGFIQARTSIPEGLPVGTSELRVRVRGNGERYFVHLRTTRTRLPWQYYHQGFDTGSDWRDVTLPLRSFSPSGRTMRDAVAPEEIRSIGVVAYGRDHEADLAVAAIGWG